jgi:hypothetical protein
MNDTTLNEPLSSGDVTDFWRHNPELIVFRGWLVRADTESEPGVRNTPPQYLTHKGGNNIMVAVSSLCPKISDGGGRSRGGSDNNCGQFSATPLFQ